MIENAQPAKASKSVLLFFQNDALFWILRVGAFVLATFFLATAPWAGGGGVVYIFLAIVLLLFAAPHKIVEIDLSARRLRIFQRFFGRWTSTLVDCPFNQCRQLGRIGYQNENGITYGMYIMLANGTQYAIPLDSCTFAETDRVASHLAEATGIPRLDTMPKMAQS